jgi:hypothetical protein
MYVPLIVCERVSVWVWVCVRMCVCVCVCVCVYVCVRASYAVMCVPPIVSRCCRLERCPAIVEAGLVVVGEMSAAVACQHMLLEAGSLHVLVPLIFGYDTTLSAQDQVPSLTRT